MHQDPHEGTIDPRQGSYTWDDLIDLHEDDERELIDGYLLVLEMPTLMHERVMAELTWHLVGWSRAHGGFAVGSGYPVRITERRGVKPDLQYFRAGHTGMGAKGLVDDAPDLAVELVSPSSRRYDHVTKLNWYRDIGTPEYWIVDPDQHTILRYVLRDGEWHLTHSLEGNDVFEPDSFEGLNIPLAELFAPPE